ncbi:MULTISPECIES: PH domain-containing protein [Microbulbifer]|uniref:PH domain-containing protein n=1 Tax=Microbulbifer TaxID=48073 RepID=UPI001E47D005|nr:MULTISPECIES: PH domain-containing protein [Microbulbifer]UHQ55219.1 PH domain-containing protein [Microbulbifer sp. YPW16]
MAIPYQFNAPWSRQLKWLTALAVLLLLAIPLILMARAPADPPVLYRVSIWLPVAILALSTLFAIRGFTLKGDAIYVIRPLWKTRLPLDGLQQVVADPGAMQGSIRIFGNGGLFGYIGLFQNKHIGRYRAFATDQAKAVILRFPERTLVVTPGRPEKLVALLQERIDRQ